MKIKNGKLGHILATETTRMFPNQSCLQSLSMLIKAAGLRGCAFLSAKGNSEQKVHTAHPGPNWPKLWQTSAHVDTTSPLNLCLGECLCHICLSGIDPV